MPVAYPAGRADYTHWGLGSMRSMRSRFSELSSAMIALSFEPIILPRQSTFRYATSLSTSTNPSAACARCDAVFSS
jgi:hypothetical protein